jgi:flagellar hook protein FlgE
MSFQQGLSGLNAASKNLDVIGNNVANAATVGFKGSGIVFADVYANSLLGAGSNAVGIGVGVANVAQNFNQGNVSVTSNPLDMAINGSGFFRLSNAGSIVYSRNGQFHLDKDGYIVNAQGANLTGYQADATGNVVQSGAGNLRLNSDHIDPKQTAKAYAVANLDSREGIGSAGTFDMDNPATYHATTSMTTYDSLGNPHSLTLYFVKTAANEWTAFGAQDGTLLDTADTNDAIGVMNFNPNGQLASTVPLALSLPTSTGATPLYNVTLDFSGTTQFGSAFGVTELRQDGYADGRLTGFAISEEGIILGRYSNGQSRAQGQVVLSNFTNPNGLQPLGNNYYAETAESGQPLDGAPLTGNIGSLQAGAVEESNVDLTQELVNMITAQRVYQANAQTIKTQDQVMQTLVNLR